MNGTDPARSEPVPGLPVVSLMLPPSGGVEADRDWQRRIERIIAWRSRLTDKYRSQLGEELAWDESSAFSVSEQPLPQAILMLAYLAAVLDQKGPGAARSLRGSPPPPILAMIPLFMNARRRGFRGSFPQWSTDAHYWFPFQRNMFIEEENWRGTVERYGSIFHLHDEMVVLRSFMADAEPNASAWPSNRMPPENDIFIGAWQANAGILRLTRAALAHRLPMWTDD